MSFKQFLISLNNIQPHFQFKFLFVIAISLQVTRLNSSYPGGLASYIKTAKELLADSKAGRNPFDGFTPSVSEYMSNDSWLKYLWTLFTSKLTYRKKVAKVCKFFYDLFNLFFFFWACICLKTLETVETTASA